MDEGQRKFLEYVTWMKRLKDDLEAVIEDLDELNEKHRYRVPWLNFHDMRLRIEGELATVSDEYQATLKRVSEEDARWLRKNKTVYLP